VFSFEILRVFLSWLLSHFGIRDLIVPVLKEQNRGPATSPCAVVGRLDNGGGFVPADTLMLKSARVQREKVERMN
jgi:hypothetical protein